MSREFVTGKCNFLKRHQTEMSYNVFKIDDTEIVDGHGTTLNVYGLYEVILRFIEHSFSRKLRFSNFNFIG